MRKCILSGPDGSRIIVIVNIAPLRDDQGKITGAINCKAVVQLDRIEVTRIKPKHFVWGYFLRIEEALPVLVVISGRADTNLTSHGRRSVSQPLLRDVLFFLATDAPCLLRAVRTDFGKCAIVGFFCAADAAAYGTFLTDNFRSVDPVGLLHAYKPTSQEFASFPITQFIASQVLAVPIGQDGALVTYTLQLIQANAGPVKLTIGEVWVKQAGSRKSEYSQSTVTF